MQLSAEVINREQYGKPVDVVSYRVLKKSTPHHVGEGWWIFFSPEKKTTGRESTKHATKRVLKKPHQHSSLTASSVFFTWARASIPCLRTMSTTPLKPFKKNITLDRSPLEIRVTEQLKTIVCVSSRQHIPLYTNKKNALEGGNRN